MDEAVEAALNEGLKFMQNGKFQDAAHSFGEVVRSQPDHGKAWGYLGIAQARIGDQDAGVQSLQQAVRLQPGDSGALFNLAVALVQANRRADAKVALEHVVSLDPTHEKAKNALASLNSQDAQQAAPPVQTVIPAYPQNPAPQTGQYSPQYGNQYPSQQPGPTGMRYAPTAPMNQFLEPTSSQRILRGLGWGALYGQWWTLLNSFWMLVYGGSGSRGSILLIVIFAIVFTIAGSILGLIIGATNLKVPAGAIAGIVFGLCFLGLEYMMSRSPTSFINIFFWFYTGRYVGALTAAKVQQPVSA